jgi:hypothetical protein
MFLAPSVSTKESYVGSQQGRKVPVFPEMFRPAVGPTLCVGGGVVV